MKLQNYLILTNATLSQYDMDVRISIAEKKIVDVLQKDHTPMEAAKIVDRVEMDRATVYRQLSKLVDSGKIEEVELGDGRKRYETSDGHHHHLVCTKCKAICDIVLKRDLKDEEKFIEREKSFKVDRHSLEFFGLCQRCQ